MPNNSDHQPESADEDFYRTPTPEEIEDMLYGPRGESLLDIREEFERKHKTPPAGESES